MTLELTGVAVAEALASSVRLGVLRFDGVTVRPSTGADSRTEIPSAALEEIERVANARIHLVRAMYRQFGIWTQRKRVRPLKRCYVAYGAVSRGLRSTHSSIFAIAVRLRRSSRMDSTTSTRSLGRLIYASVDTEPSTQESGGRSCMLKGDRRSLMSTVHSETQLPIPCVP